MTSYDETTVKKFEGLLSVLAETEKFESEDSELSVDALDQITGGVVMPNFHQFLKYVHERNLKEGK